MTEFTTMEKLQMKVGPSGAVLEIWGKGSCNLRNLHTDLPQKFTSLLRLQRKLDLDISNADLALLKRQRSILKMADTPLHGASAGIRREE